jgi:signal transduction histidine kinase
MNPQLEFMNDALHVLAQPVTALRAALELGMRDHSDQPAARKVFEDCLALLDRMTQELAIIREIASLEPNTPLELCDGAALLTSCVEEMAPVAEASGVALHLNAKRTRIECNAPTLQRAIFLLLDELIACSPGGVWIQLTRRASETRLELRPGSAPGRRRQLYRKLLESGGGRGVCFEAGRTFCSFGNGEPLHLRDGAAANKKVLTEI